MIELSTYDVMMMISKQISHLSATGKLRDENQYGIQVFQNQVDPHKLRFRFVTHDDIECYYDVDMIFASRQYFANGVRKLTADIKAHRKQRQEKGPVIIRPNQLSTAVRRTLH